MKLNHTKLSGLTLHKVDGYNVTSGMKPVRVIFWRHQDGDLRDVGPQYPTKNEALMDTNDYAVRAGWMK